MFFKSKDTKALNKILVDKPNNMQKRIHNEQEAFILGIKVQFNKN